MMKLNKWLKIKLTQMVRKFGYTIKKHKDGDQYMAIFDRYMLKRILYFYTMIGHMRHIEGDVVECGIGKGRTFQILALLLQYFEQKRNLWGFDSFEGFPSLSIEDKREDGMRQPQKGEWKKMDYEHIFKLLSLVDVRPEFIKNYIKVEKGFFKDTLHKAPIEKIALLHLDVDIYQSYIECLSVLYPKVVVGGVILFDEYTKEEKSWPGAIKAIDEYFSGKGQSIQIDPVTKKAFLIKR